MKIGFVGLGKLGLPCALAIEQFGHQVFGTDASEQVLHNIKHTILPYREVGAKDLLERSGIFLCSVKELVEICDIIFVAVQTPHDPNFEGVTPLPAERADFDYSYLVQAMTAISSAADEVEKSVVVSIISTVLPGTVAREVLPILSPNIDLCYNPFFIAMGTTIEDFLNPEFVLLGSASARATVQMKEFYSTLHDAEVVEMSIESAELTKVAYNTFIGMKIVFANTMMEICEHTNANVDSVTHALSKATKRLISPKYMKAGMGDGGGCHPRDNIAMSFLARKLDLSYDIFESLMIARERQTGWLAKEAVKESKEADLPIVILGKAFKPETNLVTGSPAILLSNLIADLGYECSSFDPFVDNPEFRPHQKAVYVVATKHDCFQQFEFPAGTVVLDPWGYIGEQQGVHVRQLGRSPRQRIPAVS